MLTGITHITVLVEDQDEALAYYTETLGFEKRDDVPTPDGRWLTVGLPHTDFPQLVLMGADDDAQREAVGRQVPDYTAFVLATDDCRKEYERLSAAGVAFEGQPTDQPWGVEVSFEDLYGNRYSLLEPRELDEAAMAALMEGTDPAA